MISQQISDIRIIPRARRVRFARKREGERERVEGRERAVVSSYSMGDRGLSPLDIRSGAQLLRIIGSEQGRAMACARTAAQGRARVCTHIPWRVQRRDKDEDEAENQVRDRMRPVAKGGGEVQCGSSEWGHGLMAWGCWAIAVCNPVTGRDKISHPVNKAAELAFPWV